MRRPYALAFLLVLAPLAFAACDGVTVVDVTQYDQTCSVDADCVLVQDGDICCGCPDAAINKGDLPRYQDDLGTCEAVCDIGCVANPTPFCDAGKCAVKNP